jgi:hypothetical protein
MAIIEPAQLHQLERRGNPAFQLVTGDMPALQSKRYVVENIQVGKECVVLEYRRNIPLMRRKPSNVAATEENDARFWQLKPCDHSEQRGLAASGRPKEGQEFASHDGQRH